MNLPWQTETEYYDLLSESIFSKYPFYHSTMIGRTKEEFAAYIIGRLDLKETDVVVDLGCGSGYLTSEINKICKCIGITTSKACLEQCRKNFPDVTFELGNMETYQCPNATHYIALESMGYADIETTFKNAYANLKEGGMFYSKDLFYYFNQDQKQNENRIYWEVYFQNKMKSVSDYVRIGYETGFKLRQFTDLTDRIYMDMFFSSLSKNPVKFEYPHPEVPTFLIAGEFIFRKEPA